MSKNIKKEFEKNSNFAKRLKNLRLQKGFSQKDLAKILDLHHVNYGRYERGDSHPAAGTLTKLADALDVSVDYLLEGETQDAAVANLEDKDLLKMFSEIEKLPAKDKEVVKTLLDAFITKKKVQQLATSAD
jgi:transcriptional regulator with XRE-family HTH domain